MNRNIIKKILKTTFCINQTFILIFLFALLFFFHSCNSQYVGYSFDQLVKGMIAYSIPDTMEIQKDYKATASITKSSIDSVLYQNLDSDDFKREEIKISSRVKLVLIDPTANKNFEITALNTEEQLVDDSTNTIWNWNVRPKKGGENELVLRATVKILDKLGENYKDITVFEKPIKVKASVVITIKQFIGDYWQWLTTVCLIPLIIWGYKKLAGRKKKNAKPNPIGFKKESNNDN